MNIAHVCLSNFYYDGYSYQENMLVKQNIKDRHKVTVIASTESINENKERIFLEPKSYKGSDGAWVVRLPYSCWVPKKLQPKVRSYRNLLEVLENLNPDLIFFHGLSAFELITIRRYKRKHPNVKIILDCHSDKYNSATNFLSKHILHQAFYKPIYHYTLPVIDKVFCISLETMDFAIDLYKTPISKVEFFPLGGICLKDDKYFKIRKKYRALYNIPDDKVLILQTGKFNERKRLVESLIQFKKVKSDNFVYIIAGSLSKDIKHTALNLISSDNRIHYQGWASSETIQGLLCASDLYLQPGTQSATMQQALCLRNPVILADVKSHRAFINKNGWLINDMGQISKILQKIVNNKAILNEMSIQSYNIARELLDYECLAKRMYNI